MGWNLRVQYISMITVSLAALILLISVYQNWFIPNKLILFILMMMTAGLFAVHIIQQQHKKLKEMTLITTLAIYLVLIVSVAIHNVWVWEAVINKQGMTKLSLVMFGVVALYGIFVYYRAKKSNKRVKGNRQHNNRLRVSEREKRKLTESDDIYLILGEVYENPKA
jgi:glucan phosphoethanolaminetransferase (alkaline phosphatase superfamily)